MIVASPSDAAYVLELIREFDKPLDNHQPVERKLRYVKANDILPVLVDVLQDTGTGETMLPGGRQIQTRPTPVTSSQLATLTGTNQSQQNTQNRNQQAAAGTAEVGGREDQISFPLDDVAPISVLVGKTRVIADRQSNAIIVSGTRESEQIVLDMIDRLDQRPVQVYLATVIGELTLSDDAQFGVDYIQRFAKWNGDKPGSGGFTSGNLNGRPDLIGTTNQNGNIANMADMITATPFGPTSGLNFYGQIGQSLDVIVTALQETKRFKVLSRPVVYTQNGKRAEITSGQEVPYPNSSVTDTTNPNSIRSTVDFKEVVLKLEVLPTINEDNEVTLDIVQVNDRIVGSQVVDQNEIPIIGKQELNTTVSVGNRSTIILGGLISESKDTEDAGIPFLKDLPIVGYAAKNTAVAKKRSELMIFIQPIVVRNDQDAAFASYDEDVRTEIGEDAAATFPEPGNPTIMHRAEEVRDAETDESPWKRLGRKLFGKQKVPREPLP
jgi:type II secretory pathway component GspD/PulD (secretin)